MVDTIKFANLQSLLITLGLGDSTSFATPELVRTLFVQGIHIVAASCGERHTLCVTGI